MLKKLIKMIINLFKKHKEADLVIPSMITNIPKREELTNPHLVDAYKSEFNKILEENKTFLTSHFHQEEITSKIDMYINILIDLASNEALETYSLINLNEEELCVKEVELKITSLKLSHYLNELKDIQKKLTYSMVALQEIFEELKLKSEKKQSKIFSLNDFWNKKWLLLKSKINTLNEVINQLSCTSIIVGNQIEASTLTNISAQTKIEVILEFIKNKGYVSNKNKTDEIILKKLKPTLEYLKVLNLDISESQDSFLQLVKGDILLETYVYSHTDDVNTIRTNIDILTSEIDDKKYKEKEFLSLLPRLQVLEKLSKIFYTYGSNILSSDDLKNLFEMKIQYLAALTRYEKKSLLKYIGLTDKIEKQYLCKIIERHIFESLNDPYVIQDNRLHDFVKNSIVIKELLRNDQNKFVALDILQSEFRFKVLLYLVGHNNHIHPNIFEILIPKNEFERLNFFEDILKWDDYISLDALCRLLKYSNNNQNQNKLAKKYKTTLQLHDFWDIEDRILHERYDEYYLHYDTAHVNNGVRKSYFLLEGIVEINLDEWPHLVSNGKSDSSIERHYISQESKDLLNYVRKHINNGDIIMPTTLRSIRGGLFASTASMHEYYYGGKFCTIYLNNRLSFLGEDTFDNVRFSELHIPASVEKIEDIYINEDNAKIIFDDYENSKMLNTREGVKFFKETLIMHLRDYTYPTTKFEIVLKSINKDQFVFTYEDLLECLKIAKNEYFCLGLDDNEEIAYTFIEILLRRALQMKEKSSKKLIK